MVRILLPVQEFQVLSLGQEDPLEKGMATHSTILAWEIPWTEDPGGPPFMGSQKSQTGLKRLNTTTNIVFLASGMCAVVAMTVFPH